MSSGIDIKTRQLQKSNILLIDTKKLYVHHQRALYCVWRLLESIKEKKTEETSMNSAVVTFLVWILPIIMLLLSLMPILWPALLFPLLLQIVVSLATAYIVYLLFTQTTTVLYDLGYRLYFICTHLQSHHHSASGY